jgi:hypothetical protein
MGNALNAAWYWVRANLRRRWTNYLTIIMLVGSIGSLGSVSAAQRAQSSFERPLFRQLMTGAAKPRIMKIDKGASLVRQGEKGSDVYLILDGVHRIEVNNERVAEQLSTGRRREDMSAG